MMMGKLLKIKHYTQLTAFWGGHTDQRDSGHGYAKRLFEKGPREGQSREQTREMRLVFKPRGTDFIVTMEDDSTLTLPLGVAEQKHWKEIAGELSVVRYGNKTQQDALLSLFQERQRGQSIVLLADDVELVDDKNSTV
jgi:hypothetical protein